MLSERYNVSVVWMEQFERVSGFMRNYEEREIPRLDNIEQWVESDADEGLPCNIFLGPCGWKKLHQLGRDETEVTELHQP